MVVSFDCLRLATNWSSESTVERLNAGERLKDFGGSSLSDFLPIDIIINIFTINKIHYRDAQVGTAIFQGKAFHLPLRQELLQLCCTLYSYQAKARWEGISLLTQAPGPIVKPKAENKRGRPRKQPLPNSSFSTFQQPRKSPSSGTNDTGQ